MLMCSECEGKMARDRRSGSIVVVVDASECYLSRVVFCLVEKDEERVPGKVVLPRNAFV
jgi:hypothetical protein